MNVDVSPEQKALGLLADFYEYAQDIWIKKGLVPKQLFELGGFGPILEVGLAEERDGGIYAKGGKERFAWLARKVEAGRIGGIRSAQSRIEKARSKRKQTEANTKQAEVDAKQRYAKRSKRNLTVTVTDTVTVTPTASILGDTPAIAVATDEQSPRKKNKVALEISLEKRSVAVADRLMGIFREVGGNENAAKEKLPPWVWRLIESRWLKWDAFCVEATNAFRDGKATYFQAQLRASITAALLLEVDSRTNQASPSNGISPPNAQICPIND
jgi:hypothetical protein